MSRAARRPDPLRVSQADLDRAKRWPIGQPVTVTLNDGGRVDAATRSAPFQQRGTATWCILLVGLPMHALARVTER